MRPISTSPFYDVYLLASRIYLTDVTSQDVAMQVENQQFGTSTRTEKHCNIMT